MSDLEHFEHLVEATRQVLRHYENEGHTPEIEGDCCLCWGVAILRGALDAYELERMNGGGN